jgi:hypothetical protein
MRVRRRGCSCQARGQSRAAAAPPLRLQYNLLLVCTLNELGFVAYVACFQCEDCVDRMSGSVQLL